METNIGRKFNFGKHKDEFILDIIKKNPYYIEWCFTNISWFKLNDIEQSYYEQTMKDWLDAWNNVRYAFKRGAGASKEIYKTVELYKKGQLKPCRKYFSVGDLSAIQSEFSRYIDYDCYSEYNEIDDICLGSDPMALFG